jgi:hypothetical protein
LPLKPGCDSAALSALLASRKSAIDQALSSLRTVHFARFVFLQDRTQLAIITEFDGPFDDYIADFAHHIGPIFDALFEQVIDAPPLPVAKNVAEFTAWVKAHDLPHDGFFSAYPSLAVLDIQRGAEEQTAAE